MKKFNPIDLWTIIILLTGVGLRLYFITDYLWFDEIWSLKHADSMTNTWSVFTLHHDNNHYLNTLWLRLLDTNASVYLLRLPALLCGITLPFLITWWARKSSAREGVIIASLLSVSFLFIKTSIEARGYAPMLLCGFIAYLLMIQLLQKPTKKTALLYGVTISIAFLWHLTVLFLFMALGILATFVLINSKDAKKMFTHLFIAHSIPLVTIVLLYSIDIRYFDFGVQIGIPLDEALEIIIGAIVGPYPAGKITAITECGILLILIRHFDRLLHTDSEAFVFKTSILFLAPVLGLIIYLPTMLTVRMFLFPLLFVLILLKQELKHMHHIVVIIIVFLYSFGNIYGLHSDIENYRITYVKEFAYVLNESAPDVPTIGSSSDLMMEMLLYQHHRTHNTNEEIIFIPEKEFLKQKPEWLFIQTRYRYTFPKEIVENIEKKYTVQSSPALEGSHWEIYRKN